MAKGEVVGICISSEAGAKMEEVDEVQAEAGQGLVGDRYHGGNGSFNRQRPGKRQVTLMNAMFFEGSGFNFPDSRRNIFVNGVELMDLIGKEFQVGDTVFRGLKYCDPCQRPSKLAGIEISFSEAFVERGGLVAEIIRSGVIRVGSTVIPPKKDY
jgi:MOSC domain-containing protein YiiM